MSVAFCLDPSLVQPMGTSSIKQKKPSKYARYLHKYILKR
jgi:hypothetical protein